MELSLSLKSALASHSLILDGLAVEDTVGAIGSALCRHRLHVTDRTSSSEKPIFCGIDGHDLGIFYLRYGTPVEVISRWPDTCYLVQTTLAGQGSFWTDGKVVETRAGSTVLALPGQEVRSTSTADCERLLVRIDRRLIERELGRRTADRQPRPPAPGATFAEAAAQSWSLAVAHLVAQRQLVPEPAWTRLRPSLVGGLVAYLLDLQGDGALAGDRGAALLPSSLRRAIRFVDDHLAEVLTLDVLARRLDAAPRTLHTNFRRFLNTTPSAYIRQARLARLDAALRDPADGRSITEMMLDCGIAHHSRFAAYFQRRFGMRPSELRNSVRLASQR